MIFFLKDNKKAFILWLNVPKVTAYLQGKVLSSDLDKIKEIAVECMKDYITQLNLTDADKEELKQNHECWADMVLKGIKQRLYESGKLK